MTRLSVFTIVIISLTSNNLAAFGFSPSSIHDKFHSRPEQGIFPDENTSINSSSSSKKRAISQQSPPPPLRGGDIDRVFSEVTHFKEEIASRSFATIIASLWGAGGVVLHLATSIRRVIPIVMEPFMGRGAPLTSIQQIMLIISCIWFSCNEGYQFYSKISPLIVKRSLTLNLSTSPMHHLLLGPLYCLGMIHSTPKRMKMSWGVVFGVGMIIPFVRKLAYPWRNIVNAGLTLALSIGTVSTLAGYVVAITTGLVPSIDPELPSSTSNSEISVRALPSSLPAAQLAVVRGE